ncbi:LysR family transcriptional regulator [Plantactinospora endophytica]|uniref:LysR family transcriptional regulator n=1 Tax=Plantactinospora endophytica TaxID=673535 RepID=A0ABQ4E230_9ACTN|nr:LysR family transcriptional regulator [Plantactinospora endophytica]GIG88761.1 LysR family transcriptional regulator [Plantactinospora endophytica]
MERLETRELAYFVVVAEEQHVGRAAERLGMAQPPLSRAIKKLERRIGVPLLERAGRGIRLTTAGEVLRREAGKVLDAAAAAGHRTRRAGETGPRLVLAMKPGADAGMLPDILAAYRAQPAAATVDVHVCGVGEQAGLLRAGAVDMALMVLPYDDTSGFDTELLRIDGQIAILPAGHQLAGRPSVRLDDLQGETQPRWPGMPGTGPVVRDAAQLMQLISLGETIAIVPAAAKAHLRHDLVAVPVLDAEPISLVLAWPEHTRSATLATFVRTAAEVAADQRPRDRLTGGVSGDSVGRRRMADSALLRSK